MSGEVNIPLLRKAVEWVEKQDKLPKQQRQWDQADWLSPEDVRIEFDTLAPGCGTAYCLAGYVAQLLDEDYKHSEEPDGKPHSADFADTALGLPADHRMFSCNNSAADIRRIAESIAGESL
jgi:hypothetical protein